MIVEAILNVFKTLLTFVLQPLPSIPSIPQGLLDGISTITDSIAQVVGVFAYIYTPALFIFVFILLVAVLTFDSIYRFVLWVWHKVRGG